MKFERILFYGALIWVIMYFIGWFLMTILPSTFQIVSLILGLLVVYNFSRSVLDEKNMLPVGIIWFVVSLILDLIFRVLLLGNNSYFSGFSVFILYIILMIEPAIVKQLSK